jgi:pimeloyl-ACP methyl ester carboxylesterase/class 3 adenylate cyclase
MEVPVVMTVRHHSAAGLTSWADWRETPGVIEPPETRYARSGDLHIAYQVTGEGPRDLVMVPGFVSNVETTWEIPAAAEFLRRLASFSRLILFDKRGTGLSDRVPVSALPSLEARMDDVRAVLDAAGSTRASLFGISEGGPMSVLFAATYPARVDHLVIYGSYARRRDAEPDNGAALVKLIESEWGTGKVLAGRSAGVAADDDLVAILARVERQSATPGAATALIRMAAAIDVSAVLPSVSVPTLVLHRTADPSLRVEGGRALAAGIPGARLVELSGVGHIPWFGHSGAILDEIEEFLTGARRQPAPERVLATVLFADIVSSTEHAVGLGDSGWRLLLDRFDEITRREVGRFRGREINRRGDDFLATFDGPARAAQCALAISTAMRPLGIETRAGVHTGEIELRGEDVGGIAVHIGARVCSLAAANEVLTTRTVRDLTVGSDLRFSDRGDHSLKGVPDPMRIYRVEG